ncbi:MAG: LD-carboxypeptidase [Lentisphaeraceae bacterium]|nr:LD-carboxypeptidase [Lentisphaeraceae bacterium]
MKIAITAPAGHVNSTKLSQGVKFLRSLGYDDFVIGETCESKYFWNSAPAEQRAAEFTKFWKDPEVDIVMAARGGFGCAHLLDLIDWSDLANHSKVLCGHSDITILHLLFRKFAISKSYSGIMPAVELSNEKLDDFTTQSFLAAMKGERFQNFDKMTGLKVGSTKGHIIPVTLSVMCSLLGSAYFPDLNGCILLIEDVNEPAYRIDAYMTQLRNSGVLDQLNGLIWGDFGPELDRQDLDQLMTKFSGLVKGPVASNADFGHCLPRMTIESGAFVNFEVNDKTTVESVGLDY